jgi:hypothetical protein
MHIPQNQRLMPMAFFPVHTRLVKAFTPSFHDAPPRGEYVGPSVMPFVIMPNHAAQFDVMMEMRMMQEMANQPRSVFVDAFLETRDKRMMWDAGVADFDSSAMTTQEKAVARLMALKFNI